jgi:uncharacterized protein (TIGR02271 family)
LSDVHLTTKPEDSDEIKLKLNEEELQTAKKTVVTGRVQVSTITREHEALVDEMLSSEHVEIERTPVGKAIDAIPAIREEGDVTIVPVVEETLVLRRQLVLKEEVRIRRVHDTERYQERVTLRKQEAVVTRFDEETNKTGGGA